MTPGCFKNNCGGHPWLQTEIGIGCVNHGRIGYDVLCDDRFKSDLGDYPLEVFIRIGIYGKGGALVWSNPPDVGFIDVGDDPHLRKVCGENEQLGGLKTGSNSLAGIDQPRDHNAIDRGTDDRVFKVNLILIE